MKYEEYVQQNLSKYTPGELEKFAEIGLRATEKETTRQFLKDINYGSHQAISQKLKSVSFCIAVNAILQLPGGFAIAERYVDATRNTK